jgi:hypothetical protein
MDSFLLNGINVPNWKYQTPVKQSKESTMSIMRVGIDLAKNVFQLHGVDIQGKVVLQRQLRRTQMLAFFKKLAPTLIGMEACASSHFWARSLMAICKAVHQRQ